MVQDLAQSCRRVDALEVQLYDATAMTNPRIEVEHSMPAGIEVPTQGLERDLGHVDYIRWYWARLGRLHTQHFDARLVRMHRE